MDPRKHAAMSWSHVVGDCDKHGQICKVKQKLIHMKIQQKNQKEPRSCVVHFIVEGKSEDLTSCISKQLN